MQLQYRNFEEIQMGGTSHFPRSSMIRDLCRVERRPCDAKCDCMSLLSNDDTVYVGMNYVYGVMDVG